MSDKKKPDDRQAQRTGSVVPEDPDLTTWLHQLWARDEFPERIEVHQVFGRNKLEPGMMIHHVNFKPNDKLDIERVTKLSNEIMIAAQNDCNSVERKQHYMLSVKDPHQKASALVRRLGPLMPKRNGYLAKLGDEHLGDDDDDDLPLDGKTLDLARIRESHDQIRWEKQRNDRVLGQVIDLLGGMVQEQRTWNAQMQGHQMTFFMQLQDAMDRKTQRDVDLEMAKLKVMFMKDGARLGRNLLLGLFGPSSGGDMEIGGDEVGAGTNETPSNGPMQRAKKRIEKSVERTLIDGFLNDCEDAGISVALFGDWEEVVIDGERKMRPVKDKPGIFTPAQYAIFVSVKDGKISPDALDDIMPGMGGKHAITEEQIMRAMPIIPEGIGSALIQLKTIRENVRAATARKPKPDIEVE